MPNKKPKKIELTKEEKDFNKVLTKERIKVEHVFGKMKVFQILTQRFRNSKYTHERKFKNIADLYNLNYTLNFTPKEARNIYSLLGLFRRNSNYQLFLKYL